MSAFVTCKRCGTSGPPMRPLCDCLRDHRQAVRNMKRTIRQLAAENRKLRDRLRIAGHTNLPARSPSSGDAPKETDNG